jgi:YVTN family beta-propeller protein
MKGRDTMKKIFFLLSFIFVSSAFAAAPQYHVIKKIELGGEGFWDYLTVDDAARRVYVSHSSQVVVVDLNTDKVVGNISDAQGVHGIAIADEFNKGFISCGRSNTAVVFDLKTLAKTGQVPTGAEPDSIIYDPASKKIFSFNARGKSATVIDPATNSVAGTIALGGSPEAGRSDGKGKIYVNIADTSEVVEIDSKKMTVTKRFSIKPGQEPSGLAVDPDHHRVFSGCDNKVMTVLDTETGKVIAVVPIGEECDGVGFDKETGLAFSSNGSGTLSVVKESSPGKFEVVETVTTQEGARTMTIDPKTHNVLLPVGPSMPRPGSEPKAQNQSATKEVFSVLVIGK